MRLIDYFDRGADLFPQRDCLHDGTRGWTYADVRGTTHKVANGLLAPGLKQGDKVAVYSPNHAMAYAALLGIQRAGLIWAPVNARNAIEENLYILDNTDVSFLFYHSSFATTCRASRRAARRSGPSSASTRPSSTLAGQAGRTAPDLADTPEEVAILISSGGTTGRPKGVQITNRVIETMNGIFWATMPIEAPPVHLMVAPMTHAAGVCSFPLLPYGGTNIFMGTSDPGAHSRRDREAQGHAHLHAADLDLHPAGSPRHRQIRLQLAAPTWSMRRRRCRSTSWSRRSRCSARC